MKIYNVNCNFTIDAESEEDAYEKLLDYLAECVRNDEALMFEIKVDDEVTA
jgi:hypothetical protein